MCMILPVNLVRFHSVIFFFADDNCSTYNAIEIHILVYFMLHLIRIVRSRAHAPHRTLSKQFNRERRAFMLAICVISRAHINVHCNSPASNQTFIELHRDEIDCEAVFVFVFLADWLTDWLRNAFHAFVYVIRIGSNAVCMLNDNSDNEFGWYNQNWYSVILSRAVANIHWLPTTKKNHLIHKCAAMSARSHNVHASHCRGIAYLNACT